MDLRPRLQQVLVYFGLAEPEGAAPNAPRGRDRVALFAAPVLLVATVALDRGGLLAAAVAAIMAPSLLIATRIGPLAHLDERFSETEDPFFLLGVMFAGALLLLPESAGPLPPAIVASAVSATILALAEHRRYRRRLPPAR